VSKTCYGAKKVIKKFLNKDWSPSSLNKLIIPVLRIANPAVVKSIKHRLLKTLTQLSIQSRSWY